MGRRLGRRKGGGRARFYELKQTRHSVGMLSVLLVKRSALNEKWMPHEKDTSSFESSSPLE